MNYRVVSHSEISERQFSIFVNDESGDVVEDAYLSASGPSPASDVNRYFMDVFRVRPVDKSGTVIVLDGFELPSKLRGKGIGSKMLRTFIKEAKSTSAVAIYLVADNKNAERLYARFGFLPIDLTPIGTVMELELR